jgi:hypothetical protein
MDCANGEDEADCAGECHCQNGQEMMGPKLIRFKDVQAIFVNFVCYSNSIGTVVPWHWPPAKFAKISKLMRKAINENCACPQHNGTAVHQEEWHFQQPPGARIKLNVGLGTNI